MSRNSELIIGLAMLGAGIGYLFMTMQLPRRGAVDATFFPYALGTAMVGLGLLQVIVTLRRTGFLPSTASERLQPRQILTVMATLGLVACFIAALRPLGFPVAAALFLFAQFCLLAPATQKPRLFLYVVLAVVAAVLIFVTFRYGFRLMLPGGPLTPYLP
ncbi:tripartite tricarboxylate transporter TctB family protein [Roseinatronobacter alkalisoli]|uniref:Tripartite tricarboxylate transporter TctB family protein n=1 Tax=Roseinatronobacter alkalisoli TaxID=3028235 RepID=A0ABT5TFW0_9RHOB|nr:tripartite tricarboxylate transporter TctB family protein [Roseinatronobacter sp. HJB301]MDD7972798.1 tripartite tricarboxylate transporter TctB family protein [Roseinatronobacter sp. HJB301]